MQDPFLNNNQNPYTPNSSPSPYQNAKFNQNQQFAEDLNQLKPKSKSKHCQALIATILLLAGQGTGLGLYLSGNQSVSPGAFIGIFAGSYVLYLMVAFICNPLFSYLNHIEHGSHFESYYDEVRKMTGHFKFVATCYHYETRHHTRTVRDSNGNTRHQHYTTTEKVITHTATQYLKPYETKDESGAVDRIRSNTTIVFIHFFVKYRFFDNTSAYNFENAFSHFKMRNTRDSHQDFSMGYQVPGLVDRKAFYVGDLQCNYKAWYILLGLLCCLWPYSLWVESKISRFEVVNMKVLKV